MGGGRFFVRGDIREVGVGSQIRPGSAVRLGGRRLVIRAVSFAPSLYQASSEEYGAFELTRQRDPCLEVAGLNFSERSWMMVRIYGLSDSIHLSKVHKGGSCWYSSLEFYRGLRLIPFEGRMVRP
jgi:hypothetical protein